MTNREQDKMNKQNVHLKGKLHVPWVLLLVLIRMVRMSPVNKSSVVYVVPLNTTTLVWM